MNLDMPAQRPNVTAGFLTVFVCVLFTLAAIGCVNASTIPPRETESLPRTIGVGAFARFASVGPEEIQIDLGCAITARSRVPATTDPYGPSFWEQYNPADWRGKSLTAYRVPSLGNSSDPYLIALFPGYVGSGGVGTIQDFTGYVVEADAPIPRPQSAYQYGGPRTETLGLRADGAIDNTVSLYAPRSIAPACVHATGTILGDPTLLAGYEVTETSEDSVGPSSLSKSIKARFAITKLENAVASQISATDLLALESATKAGLGELQISDPDFALSATNLDALIARTADAKQYGAAYSEIVAASTDPDPRGAVAKGMSAERIFAGLGDYLNSAQLETAATAIVQRGRTRVLAAEQRQAQIAAARAAAARVQGDRKQAIAAAQAAAQKSEISARLEATARSYPPQLGALIRRFGRVPDWIGTGQYEGVSATIWRFGARDYYIRGGLILGHT